MRPVAAIVWPWAKGRECLVAEALAVSEIAARIVPGFGASDCRCPGHLLLLAVHSPQGLAAYVSESLKVMPATIVSWR